MQFTFGLSLYYFSIRWCDLFLSAFSSCAEQRGSATSVFFNVMENTCLPNATTELHEQAETPAASQAANLRKFQVFKED